MAIKDIVNRVLGREPKEEKTEADLTLGTLIPPEAYRRMMANVRPDPDPEAIRAGRLEVDNNRADRLRKMKEGGHERASKPSRR